MLFFLTFLSLPLFPLLELALALPCLALPSLAGLGRPSLAYPRMFFSPQSSLVLALPRLWSSYLFFHRLFSPILVIPHHSFPSFQVLFVFFRFQIISCHLFFPIFTNTLEVIEVNVRQKDPPELTRKKLRETNGKSRRGLEDKLSSLRKF